MADPVNKARQMLEALESVEDRTGEHFSKLKDDAEDAYMKRVEQIRKDGNVSLMEAHRLAQADAVAVEAYDRSQRISDEHAVQADVVRGIASNLEE